MSELVVPLVGEPLALDLVNTRFSDGASGRVDLLEDRAGFDAWCAALGSRLPLPAGRAGDVDLRALRDVRAHIEHAIASARLGEEPSPAALTALTTAQAAAPGVRVLGWGAGAVTATPTRSGDVTLDLVAELVDATADLLTDPAIRSVRRCEGSGCRLLFLPAHPRRRWCSPTTCGNRARVARYYRRHQV
jgi:predicted RNA-binding Zn ribbon-like protein